MDMFARCLLIFFDADVSMCDVCFIFNISLEPWQTLLHLIGISHEFEFSDLINFNISRNKIKLHRLRAVNITMRKGIGHTVVTAAQATSVTLWIWQNRAKKNYCNSG